MRFVCMILSLFAAVSCAAQPPASPAAAPGEGLSYDRDLGWYSGADAGAKTPPGRFREAKNFFDNGNYDSALDAFDSWLTDFQNHSLTCNALFYYAECLFHTGDYSGAYQNYKKIMDEAPEFERISDIQDRIQQIGLLALNGEIEDADFGTRVLEDLVISYPYEYFSPRVLYNIAGYYMNSGDYHSATEAFMAVERRYPDSALAEDAGFKAAQCSGKLSKGLDYDLRPYLASKRLYEIFLARYPNSGRAKEAENAISSLKELLAGVEMKVARYYIGEDKPFSARLVLDGVIRDYPETGTAQTAKDELKKLPGKTLEQAEKEYPDAEAKKNE